jgi:hypothetical protein
MFESNKLKILPWSFAFIFSLIMSSAPAFATTTNIQKATESLEAYVRALQNGSAEKAQALWNQEEVVRYRFYDWQWSYLALRGLNPPNLNFLIVAAEDHGDHVVLEVEWYYHDGKSGPVQKDRRYFIEQNGKMVGANPIFVRTRNWLKAESKHFVYHFKNETERPDLILLDWMDRFFEKVEKRIYSGYDDRIDYYKCDSTGEVGAMFDLDPSLARSRAPSGVIASVREFSPHEVVHILSYRILGRDEIKLPPEYLSEGLAYYLGGASFFSPEFLLSWAQHKMERERIAPLDSLINNPWIYGANEGAGLLAFFAKFLMDTKGLGTVKELFKAGGSYEAQKQYLKRIFPAGMEQAQQNWEMFVLGTPLPEIVIDEPINCRSVCDLYDPEGDDKGDGNYTYPKNDLASPGIFDLTRLRVSLDEELVYFQLYFSDLNQTGPLSDESFNGTFAAIAIDKDDHPESGNTRLFFDNGNFEFPLEDGYELTIEVSNSGILVYDQEWVWQSIFLKAFSLQDHIRENEIYFAVPQTIIGVPDSSWKLQVMTGGQKGGYKEMAYGVGRFMRVGAESSSEQGGSGTETEFNPDVYDILTPEGQNQIQILGNYDAAGKKKAVIPMVRLFGK